MQNLIGHDSEFNFTSNKTSKGMTMYNLVLFFATFGVLANLTLTHAQGDFILSTDDDSCELVRTVYIGRYPPKLPDMPWYIVNSYAAADSVSRSVDIEVIQDSIRNLSDEVLRLGYYHVMAATDYNPLLLHHYWWHATYGEGGTYVTKPRYPLATIFQEYHERFGEPDSNQNKILDATAGIYEVYIEDVAFRADSGYYGFPMAHVETAQWCAHAVIHNKIHGQITNFPDVALDGESYSTITLSWHNFSIPSYEWPDDPNRFLTTGNTYLTFAQAIKMTLWDESCEWRITAPKIFLIDESGHIQDPLRFFGSTPVITIDEARTIIHTWKSSLLSIGM